MRTYELTATAKQVQRSHGRSSVAASAYRSASLIYDNRTGITHDYRNKKGVEHSEIFTPDNAPEFAKVGATLWNAVEEKEKKSNSITARERIVAFPHEFNIFQRKEAGASISREIMNRYNCAVESSYHKADKIIDTETGEITDNKNNHVHIMFTNRGFDESTKDGWSKTKFRNYSHDRITINGETTTKASHENKTLRAFIAGEINRIAQRDNLQVKTEHLSFKERGIDQEATQHLGYVASDMKKKGKASQRENINIEIRASNDNRAELKQQKQVIQFNYERQKKALAQQEKNQQTQAQELKANLKARNKLLGFVTGKTQAEKQKLEEIQASLKQSTAKQSQQQQTERRLNTELKQAEKVQQAQKLSNDNILSANQGKFSQEFNQAQESQVISNMLSPEQIAENVKAQQANFKPPESTEGDLKDEYRERLELYKAEQEKGLKDDSQSEKPSHGHKPEL